MNIVYSITTVVASVCWFLLGLSCFLKDFSEIGEVLGFASMSIIVGCFIIGWAYILVKKIERQERNNKNE
ncbi:MAG: hypothetical protein GY827_09130 [Cytophagales bacterium]|nr:hypothetical protein [Cytophagales bacterium]